MNKMIIAIISFNVCFAISLAAQKVDSTKPTKEIQVSPLSTACDFIKSPYTGFTRQHWLELTERIILGELSHINKGTGEPEFPAYQAGDSAYERLRWPAREEIGKRSLERMMMAVMGIL
ncbi:MAG: hypothetical protein ACR2KZ_13165 [Segetibacter sp.]